LLLGQLFISEPVDPNAEFTPDHADAFTELFRQFAGSVAVQLTHILGKNCGIRFKDTQMPAWSSAESASLMVKTEPEAFITLQMDTGLFNSITKALISSEPKAEPHAAMAEPAKPLIMSDETATDEQASAIPDEMADQSGALLTDKNLDLLLDVELEVSIRFGRRTMLLKDVLDLTSGAMVELDRRVRDPIELLLGGRVIARGEAVIVDGNYGIRITEIIPHSQRMAEIA
jgi:flagellar motor switch protein FliN